MSTKVFLLWGCFNMFLMTGCGEKRVIPSQDAKVKAISNHGIIVQTYRLPKKGKFMGFYWDFKNDHAFKIEIDREGREQDYIYIPVSDEFLNYDEKDTGDDWNFEVNENKEKRLITYLVGNKEKNIYLKVELPFKEERYYHFSMLTNNAGEDIILFGNLTDKIIHEKKGGIFGYIIVKEKNMQNNQTD